MEAKTPAKRALAALDAPKSAEPVPERRISGRVRRGIEALVTGDCKSISEAAETAGLSREHFTRELGKPHITEHLRQRVLKTLAIGAARAGATKIDLLDSPNEMARDRASSFVLGLAGIQPETSPSLNVNIEVKAGYVIDLSDDPRQQPGADVGMRIVSSTVVPAPVDLDHESAE